MHHSIYPLSLCDHKHADKSPLPCLKACYFSTAQGWLDSGQWCRQAKSDLCENLLFRLAKYAPVSHATNVAEEVDLALGSSIGEQAAGVDGPQGDNALSTGMQLSKP